MFSAVLPIQIAQNQFWNSSNGIQCVKNFMEMVNGIRSIDHSIVVTADHQVAKLAEQYRQEVLYTEDINCSMDAYTFEKTDLILNKVADQSSSTSDAFIFMDHRNLCLTNRHIEDAITRYTEKPDACVIGLSQCEDHVCQFRSFFIFKDCFVCSFGERSGVKENYEVDIQNATIRITEDQSHFAISLHRIEQMEGELSVQAIPFTETAPLYNKTQEIHIDSENDMFSIEKIEDNISGFIFNVFQPSRLGGYDMMEMFAPANGSWELCKTGEYIIADKKTGKKMTGRQMFPKNYTYNGSMCILGKKQIMENEKYCFIPLFIDPACIVVDEVDYLSVCIQKEAGSAT